MAVLSCILHILTMSVLLGHERVLGGASFEKVKLHSSMYPEFMLSQDSLAHLGAVSTQASGDTVNSLSLYISYIDVGLDESSPPSLIVRADGIPTVELNDYSMQLMTTTDTDGTTTGLIWYSPNVCDLASFSLHFSLCILSVSIFPSRCIV